jgi:hypothetical protein
VDIAADRPRIDSGYATFAADALIRRAKILARPGISVMCRDFGSLAATTEREHEPTTREEQRSLQSDKVSL